MLQYLAIFCIFMSPLVSFAAKSITLMGSNGRKVEFAGVLEARPEGLALIVNEEDEVVTVPWERFDMPYMEDYQFKIYEAAIDSISYRRTVPLYLGVYEDYISYQQALDILATEMNKKQTVPVPTYNQYLEEANRTYWKTNKDYEDYAKDRRKVYDDYSAFLKAFFAGKDVRLEPHVDTYYGNVYSVTMDKDKVEMSSKEIIAFFAKNDNRYRQEGMIYLQNNPQILQKPLGVLRGLEKQVPSPLFNRKDADQIYFETLLINSIRDLEHLQTEKSYPHSAMRNFEVLLKTINKGKVRQSR